MNSSDAKVAIQNATSIDKIIEVIEGTSARMQVVAELHQGRRTIMENLLSPVQKVASEAGKER